MACGYMTVLTNNVFKGTYTNGAANAVANGTLMVLGADGKTLVLPAADTTTKLVCIEETTIYDGIAAHVFNASVLAKQYYFVENQFDINDSEAYDETKYVTEKGKYLRAHPVQVGDEFVIADDGNTYVVGTAYGVKTTGVVG